MSWKFAWERNEVCCTLDICHLFVKLQIGELVCSCSDVYKFKTGKTSFVAFVGSMTAPNIEAKFFFLYFNCKVSKRTRISVVAIAAALAVVLFVHRFALNVLSRLYQPVLCVPTAGIARWAVLAELPSLDFVISDTQIAEAVHDEKNVLVVDVCVTCSVVLTDELLLLKTRTFKWLNFSSDKALLWVNLSALCFILACWSLLYLLIIRILEMWWHCTENRVCNRCKRQ